MRQRDSLSRWIAALLALSVLLLAAMTAIIGKLYWDYRHGGTPDDATEETGEASVQPMLFTRVEGVLRDADGREHALESWRGQPALLFFWSSWCDDCERFLRDGFEEMAQQAEQAGVRVELVCREGVRGDDAEAAKAALKRSGVTRATLLDPDAALYRSLGLRAVPSVALLDAQGALMYTSQRMPSPAEAQALFDYAQGGALPQTRALVRGMIGEDGGLASAYRVRGGALAPEACYLSETQGLLMQWALLADSRETFDSAYAFACEALGADGLFAWKLESGERGQANATLDDLRIAEQLLAADARWGGYRDAADTHARALYDAAVADGLMVDFVELDTARRADAVTLCYQDAAAMRRLAQTDERWTAVAERAEALLRNGVISEAFPLLYPRYDARKHAYTGDILQMNEAMVAVLNAVRIGAAREETLDWLENALQSGPLYAAYTLNGAVAQGYRYESTATYALLAQIGVAANRPRLARMAWARLEGARCFTPPLNGGYGSISDQKHYTFDVLQALLAMEQAASVR